MGSIANFGRRCGHLCMHASTRIRPTHRKCLSSLTELVVASVSSINTFFARLTHVACVVQPMNFDQRHCYQAQTPEACVTFIQVRAFGELCVTTGIVQLPHRAMLPG